MGSRLVYGRLVLLMELMVFCLERFVVEIGEHVREKVVFVPHVGQKTSHAQLIGYCKGYPKTKDNARTVAVRREIWRRKRKCHKGALHAPPVF